MNTSDSSPEGGSAPNQPLAFSPNLVSGLGRHWTLGPERDQSKRLNICCVCFSEIFCFCYKKKKMFECLCTERSSLPASDHKWLYHWLLWEANTICIRLPSLPATGAPSQTAACSIRRASRTQRTTPGALQVRPGGPCWELRVSLGHSVLQTGRPWHSTERAGAECTPR